MTDRYVDQEIYTVNLRIDDSILPRLWSHGPEESAQYAETVRSARNLFAELSKRICKKYSFPEEAKVIGLSLDIPRHGSNSADLEDFKEWQDFGLLPSVFQPLAGQKVLCVIEIMERFCTNLRIFARDQEIFRFQIDDSPGLNMPPQVKFIPYAEFEGTSGHGLNTANQLAESSGSTKMATALRLLQLVARRARQTSEASALGLYFRKLATSAGLNLK